MDDLDEPKHEISRVAEAYRIKPNTLRTWHQKKYWTLGEGDAAARVPGASHLLSLRRALQIGVAAELIRNGVEPKRAFGAAYAFSDIEDAERPAGELFKGEKVWTALISYPDSEDGVVLKFGPETGFLTSAFLPPGEHYMAHGRQISGTLVWVNYIDFRIRTALLPGKNEYDPINPKGGQG